MTYERIVLTMKDVDVEIRRRIAERIGKTDLFCIEVEQERVNAYDPHWITYMVPEVQAELICKVPETYRFCHAQNNPWMIVFEQGYEEVEGDEFIYPRITSIT
jgi:hypothetical protein